MTIHQIRENPTSGWPESRTIVYGEWEPYADGEAAEFFERKRVAEVKNHAARRRAVWRFVAMSAAIVASSVSLILVLLGR